MTLTITMKTVIPMKNKILTSALTQSTNGALKTINSSRLTVDPEGNLFFSNVTR